jgi:hypothetical protein
VPKAEMKWAAASFDDADGQFLEHAHWVDGIAGSGARGQIEVLCQVRGPFVIPAAMRPALAQNAITIYLIKGIPIAYERGLRL